MLRFVKTLFCSIHFTLLTVTFYRAKRLFVLPKSSLNRGSLNRGSTVLNQLKLYR